MKPISLKDLKNLIINSEALMDAEVKVIWNKIKIEPEKWKEQTQGQKYNGFWIVALLNEEVIWYNDITEGFNISVYSEPLIIKEYWNEETPLHTLLWHLF